MKTGTKEKLSIALGTLLSASVALQTLASPALGQAQPAVELEGVIAREQVDGDLKTAIAAYQKIAADVSAPRDVR